MSEREGAGSGRQVTLQKIYLRDASVEVPQGPRVFTREWQQPRIDVDLDTRVQQAGEDHHHVAVTVTVTARVGEEVAYVVEVQQAGIFTVQGFNDDERDRVLGVYCPDTLFPYVREAVSDLVQRAGFPPFLLQPINFEALFRRRLEEAASAKNTVSH